MRYAHTNLVARDWRALAMFYVDVLGCELLAPGRDLAGAWVDALTGLAGSRIEGAHLRLPGHGDAGPTLEIFTYGDAEARPATAINRPGFTHIAFQVEDVAATREAILAAGGGGVGEIVRAEIAGAGTIEVVYLTDPEGNIIELQRWG